jgi:hypothetical protein
MMHDPYQNFAYQTNPVWGAYGGSIPFGLPQLLQAANLNPASGFNPQTAGLPQFGQQGYAGIGAYGNPAQQQQFQTGNPGIPPFGGISPYAAYQNPLASILQNQLLLAQLQNSPWSGGLQNQQTSPWQNPLLQNQLLQNLLQSSFLQSHSYPQFGQSQPMTQQLLPQTWIGQPGAYGGGIPFARGFQQPGSSPWACF